MSGIVEDVFGARRQERVMRGTWGHLDAHPGVAYRGHIAFAETPYGDVVVLAVDFGNAGDGPWFYDGLHDWLAEQETEPGYVFRFEGIYRLAAGGRHTFIGTTSRRPLADL